MSERRQHPSVSDVALALATRQRAESMTKIVVSDANAKGTVQVTVEINDPDPLKASEAANIYDVLRARYPRENGQS